MTIDSEVEAILDEYLGSQWNGNMRTAITNLIAQEANKAYERGCTEQIRTDNDFIKHVQDEARINELTRLDNAYDEVTPERFHEYYIERIKALTADKEQA